MSDEGSQQDSELNLLLLHSGKVRDVYEVDARTLLMVASDRISAFDVILGQPIPHKGEVLTLVTAWWLEQLEDRLAHHLIAVDPDAIIARHPDLATSRETWARRAMLVTRTQPVLVECVVRGHITGSAWKEYRSNGTLANEPLPEGLLESQRLDPPIFSPATKAEQGEHDENITIAQAQELLGTELADRLRDLSLDIYGYGRGVADIRGIILADTKFEFGFDAAGELLLIDEVLTPDSSRFWPKESYSVGRGQPSLDKQPVRDWLDELQGWNKSPPAPDLPDTVVAATSDRYQDVFHRLTGIELADYRPPLFGTDR
ncbi:MAG TPA: phosphoribosylaminoimidazolesuccinocarboxamide synthase [Gemmatimonadetes bacterium]|jgi:phosphoribosylaminoimidazole-succinocarboxamide synthase|nr:phosphoribosylaminoimidazolesuccinocarboxamide synthase [Gemmatimonadota bacterium]HIN50308.1 phosphoribosylaminoimidazolesuccinocarboxamide synthase [Gemmatimonadota bacterium]